ncbi:MAG TPA: potassium channel family protein [Gemmatimonadales bacterium]|nr:potassium channel family protein [Gemmatimonadales bacterium]
MRAFAGIGGLLLLLLVLRDAFETVILPRRIQRPFALTSMFYRTSWAIWRGSAGWLKGTVREVTLSWFGPSSLLVLLAFWAFGIIVAFALLHWSLGSALVMPGHTPGFLDDLYLSGTTFFTLGLGDVVPGVALAKVLTVVESGLGFAFLAVIIGYLPVIYQAFSRREIAISMLDARAGSPPAAGELLRRHPIDTDAEGMSRLLAEWERWAAELLESHLSYPVLAYFRSQHGNQSWLAALTTVLDTSALVTVGCDGSCARQAQLTFAMARHAAVDLAQVFGAPQPDQLGERLSEEDLNQLMHQLGEAGTRFGAVDARVRFSELRLMYEPYLAALAQHLALALPRWSRASERPDNWEAAPWKRRAAPEPPEHF